jgi:adenine-specific DNA-methyltransferase
LGKFLRGELDFYIKNEVLHLDDVQNAQTFTNIEQNLRLIQCLRAVALELVDFLASLEDFQKQLWLKKKVCGGCELLPDLRPCAACVIWLILQRTISS